ncbi:MAG: toll/interleukin-1 receptor domain-containing protein [bacterium]|nr:toll/interleukin-1 receptor domain-containing protein [bacterium]
MQIFLSHSSKDADIANQICEQLEKNGTKCFIAPRDIRPGKEYAEEIINGIDESAAVILLMSQNANSSPHVLREVEHAVSGGTPILVYKIENVVLSKSMEYFLMTHQWVSAKPQEDYADIVAFVQDLAEKEDAAGRGMTGGNGNAAGRGTAGGSGNAAGRGEAATGSVTAPKRGKALKTKAAILAAAAIVVLFAAAIAFFAMRKPAFEESTAEESITEEGTAGESTAEETAAEEGVTEETAVEPVAVQVGERVLFGSYLDEDIEWRVLRISEDGTQAVLISSHIITMKAYDAAESGRYNYEGDTNYWSRESEADTDMALQARVRGNSDWSTSNIRTWLNADKEVVTYTGQAPTASAMSEKKNGYQNEAGFLCGFTQEERDAIVETELVTKGNALSETDTVTTHDRVWLLSVDELAWFDEADISKFASPTEAAVAQDQSEWYMLDYNTYGVECLSWWLREPDTAASSFCYLVDNGYTQNVVRLQSAGLEGFGVRPALTVDLRLVTFRGGESEE